MKCRMLMIGLIISMAVVSFGCSKKNETAVELKNMKVEKYVTLPEYKGLEVSVAPKEEVADIDVTYYVKNKMDGDEQFHNTNGTVKDGDMINIDYEGTIDGVAFEGGTAQGQRVMIGYDNYIEGFLEGLVGAKAGETKELNLKFPEDYHQPDLAGKDCVFTVKVNYIVDDLTDENVSKVDADYKDAASYLQEIRNTLQSYVDYQYDYTLKNALAVKLMENCEYKNIPEGLVKDYDGDLRKSFEQAAQAAGTDLATYMSSRYYVSTDKMDETISKMADQCAKEGLALQAIANKENLNVSDEELTTELENAANSAGMASVEEYLGEDGNKEEVRVNLMYEKVYDFLAENAVITEN